MRGRIRNVSAHHTESLSAGWQVAASSPQAIKTPAELEGAGLHWVDTLVPATAAASLRAAGMWSLEGAARRFDADDWWYRTHFRAGATDVSEQVWLCFDGLATVAEVWLNGAALLTSRGMFTAQERRIDTALRPDNELVICFRSLDHVLKERRTRPKWRAPMVENQQIRWFRTTLLGRTPGWSPPAQAVGPWRSVRLERRRVATLDDVRIRADADGRLGISCRAESLVRQPLQLEVVLERDGREYAAHLTPDGDRLTAQLSVPKAELWWPHTHGEPALYAATLRLSSGRNQIEADLGHIGFRSVAVSQTDGGFAVNVNGARVFCRGACWTPLDVVSLATTTDVLDHAFSQVVDAGMNMLRVGGMMVYEEDSFLDQCDARGVLLWQDFMFANLDYPGEDASFIDAVGEEVRQQLARLQGRPSVAVLCGNSEAEQQAAMWGASRERWHMPLFHERLADIARESCPNVPYWPSSAHGGDFPHQGNAGTTSYYGVGAYLRPLEDARLAEVRFASECLAFANVPESRSMSLMPGGPATKVHDPSWKTRTPRDLGAGWDFDDVRDHYVARLFRVDPMRLRYEDHERYLALGRAATGEVMADVFAQWRRRRSPTTGGLIWFLRDLWAGAGWGVIDAAGTPKAPWYYLKRALAPVAISLSDEGGNGIGVHVVNDRATPVSGTLELSLFRFGEVRVGHGVRSLELSPQSAMELNAASFFDHFVDLSYAYRFGPPPHDVIAAVLSDDSGPVARAFYFVPGLPNVRQMDVGLSAEAQVDGDDAYVLIVRTHKLAQSVCVELEGFESDDNYFHLAPGDERRLKLRRARGKAASDGPRGTVRSLNSEAPATVTLTGTRSG